MGLLVVGITPLEDVLQGDQAHAMLLRMAVNDATVGSYF
jgi:hypothetical protein